MLVTIFTLATNPRAVAKYGEFPWAWGVVVLNVLAIANIPRAIYVARGRDRDWRSLGERVVCVEAVAGVAFMVAFMVGPKVGN
jgi:hypothetical protein